MGIFSSSHSNLPNEGDQDSFSEPIPTPSQNCSEQGGEEEWQRSMGPDKILERLYLGDRRDGTAVHRIRQNGITHVLNVNSSCRYPPANCGYVYKHEPLSDYGDDKLSEFLPRVLPFIVEGMSHGKVLVHCQQGVNRSVTVVICYLMIHEHFTLRRAYLHVQSLRRIMSPHENYFEQLQGLERELFGGNTLTRSDIGPSLQQQMRELVQAAREEKNAPPS